MTDENMGRPFSKDEFEQELENSYESNLKTETLLQENKQMSAEIQHKKLKMQKEEIDRISSIQESLEDEDLSDRKFNEERMLKNVDDRKNAVVFLNKKISKHFVAAPGSLIVIPSMTNNGKSTLTAHISEALVAEGRRVLVLSNEESEEDVRARVSCLRTGISFGDFKTNKCTPEQIDIVLNDAKLIANNGTFVVISPKDEKDAYKVTTVKGVITTMEKAKGKFDAVLLDYYTNVNMSELGVIEPWHVNNRLATELNIFKDTAPFPIIALAQCEGIKSDKKIADKASLDFDSNHPMYRWKGGKSILTYATDIIELVKDFENSSSVLFAHKVRFGHGDLQRLHVLPFDKKMQKFTSWTPEYDAQVTASKIKRVSQENGKELNLANIFNKDK